MSGFRTHMLIGAVGGLTAFRMVQAFAPATLSIRVSNQALPANLVGLGCVAVSGYLALWPDIDEPGSHISRVAPHYMWLFGAVMALCVGVAASLTPTALLILVACGALGVGISGGLLLALLRFMSGGHRRLTHSLLVGITLYVLAGFCFLLRIVPLGLPLFALAWGQSLHLIGDVVTPGGVPLFYPLWRRNIHLFPHFFTQFGEPIIGLTALIIGFVYIWV